MRTTMAEASTRSESAIALGFGRSLRQYMQLSTFAAGRSVMVMMQSVEIALLMFRSAVAAIFGNIILLVTLVRTPSDSSKWMCMWIGRGFILFARYGKKRYNGALLLSRLISRGVIVLRAEVSNEEAAGPSLPVAESEDMSSFGS